MNTLGIVQPATRLRRVLSLVAWFAVLTWSLLMGFCLLAHTSSGLSAFLLRLPLPFLSVLSLVGSFLCADIVVEMLRMAMHSSSSWPDKKHFMLVALVSFVFFAGQMTMWYWLREHGQLAT